MRHLLIAAVVCTCCLHFSPATSAGSPYYCVKSHFHHDGSYHDQVRLLKNRMRLQRAEIAALNHQLREWEPFDRFRSGRPLMMSIESSKLLLLEAELELDRLERELFELVRSRQYAAAYQLLP